MTTAIAPKLAPVRALPHVAGVSRRIKSEPTKLSPLAARVMSASGAFSVERQNARSSLAPIFGAVVLLLASGTFFLAGGSRPDDEIVQIAHAPIAQPDSLLTLGAGDQFEAPAIVVKSVHDLSSQDWFEIARLFRRSAAVSGFDSAERSGLGRYTRLAARQ